MRARRLLAGLWLGLALASGCSVAFSGAAKREADVLFEQAQVLASPERETYDPHRAAELLAAFVERFPSHPRAGDAADRLALLNEVLALRAELRALKAVDLARPPR